mmetsp:Transcript_21129/g.37257  ORF Transcript_21129/g.37257 Transcript_21129/m.37257 type:complete len:243 (+) Transcript_21129:74-802(+)
MRGVCSPAVVQHAAFALAGDLSGIMSFLQLIGKRIHRFAGPSQEGRYRRSLVSRLLLRGAHAEMHHTACSTCMYQTCREPPTISASCLHAVDGSDLGRGAKSVDVFNGKPAAASPTGQVAGTMPRPTETARRDAKLDGRAILANAASLPDHMLSERLPRPRARDREKELEFLDSISASWPFFLVQSLFLICCGFMLRGYTDRRRRRRMFPNSSLAEPPRGAERHNRHTSLQTGQRHGDEVPL